MPRRATQHNMLTRYAPLHVRRNCRASLLKRQQQAAPRRSTCRQLHGSGSTVPKECAKPQLQVKQDWDDLLGAWPLGGSALGAAEPMELAPSCEAGAGAVATNQLVEEILAEMFDAEVAGAAEQAPARSSFSRSSSVSSDHELEAMIEDELRAAALAASQPGAGRPTLAPQAAAPAPSTAELLQQEWAAAVAMPPHAGGCLPACVVAAQPGPQRVERLQGLLEQYQQLQATIEQLRIHVTQLCAAVPAC